MHLPINVKSPNNISKWQMEFNSAFKGLTYTPKEVSVVTKRNSCVISGNRIMLTVLHYFHVGWKTDEANSPLVCSARFPKGWCAKLLRVCLHFPPVN
jgi:hypothetical protein